MPVRDLEAFHALRLNRRALDVVVVYLRSVDRSQLSCCNVRFNITHKKTISVRTFAIWGLALKRVAAESTKLTLKFGRDAWVQTRWPIKLIEDSGILKRKVGYHVLYR